MNSSKYYIVYQRFQRFFCFVLFCFLWGFFHTNLTERDGYVDQELNITSNVQIKYEKGQAFLKDITSKGY